MYYEIESKFNMEKMIFDDTCLTVGKRVFPYDEIEKMEITKEPLFATYGIFTITTGEKEILIPFPRFSASKIRRALSELERERSKADNGVNSVNNQKQTAGTTNMDPYEEVKKLKELLDMDIITEEEFQKKKKELLGL